MFACGKSQIGQPLLLRVREANVRVLLFSVVNEELLRTNCRTNVGKLALTEEAVCLGREARFEGEREVSQTFTVAPVLENQRLRLIYFFIIIVHVNIIPCGLRHDLQRLVLLQIPRGGTYVIPPDSSWPFLDRWQM